MYLVGFDSQAKLSQCKPFKSCFHLYSVVDDIPYTMKGFDEIHWMVAMVQLWQHPAYLSFTINLRHHPLVAHNSSSESSEVDNGPSRSLLCAAGSDGSDSHCSRYQLL